MISILHGFSYYSAMNSNEAVSYKSYLIFYKFIAYLMLYNIDLHDHQGSSPKKLKTRYYLKAKLNSFS
jgi:hypothetical protein